MFNEKITDMLVSKLSGLTLTTDTGKFFADKSYGFDTLFLGARFINRFRFGNVFHKLDLKEKSNKYFADLFCLRDASQVQNYMTEVVALLCFARILQKENRNAYRIIDDELLDFVSSSFEHAYIFQYMLIYCVFKEDGIWTLYEKFCREESIEGQQNIYMAIREIFIEKDSRILDPSKEWANFVPKYPLVILNYANRQKMVSRTCRVQRVNVKRTDIALNVNGTRANTLLPKKNAYLDDLSDSYITATLYNYLVVKPEQSVLDNIKYSDNFSIDVADTKLDMLDVDDATQERKRKMQGNKYKLTASGVRVRTVQDEFKSGLLRTLPHVCPVCGFRYDKLLIASHIKPYAVCDDTYDAMNPNNGFLMCPICDKLFESANYITIDSRTGKILYVKDIDNLVDFKYLHERKISVNYIDCERRHYLRWHNEQFMKKHSQIDSQMLNVAEPIVHYK